MDIPHGYKQTEIGVIPSDWVVKPIGELFEVNAGGDFKKDLSSNFRSESYPYPIYSNSLVDSGLYGYSSYHTSEANCITVTARGTIGNANYRDHRFTAIGRVLVLKPQEDIDCFFISEYINNRIKFVLEVTGVPQLTAPQISKYLLALPPTKAEQTAIAAVLNDADALLAALETLLAKKRHIKQGAMQVLLQPQAGWEVKKLGEVATLKARIGWQGLTTAEYRDTGDYFLITGTEFKNGFIDWENCVYVDEKRYKQDKNIQIRAHDVLVTKDGTIGKVALIKSVPKPATLNSGVFVIRPINNSFHPEFFYYLLLSNVFLSFLSQLSAGSTINHLYQKDFVSFQFLTPKTIEEQTRITRILADMDAEITALEQQLAKYRMIKQGLMQHLLTGRIRLL